MDSRDIRRSVLAERELVSVEVLKFLSHRSLVRAKDITQHVIDLGILSLPNDLNQEQLESIRICISLLVLWGLRRRKLVRSEGRYKYCHANTQYQITEDGRKIITEQDNKLSPSSV